MPRVLSRSGSAKLISMAALIFGTSAAGGGAPRRHAHLQHRIGNRQPVDHASAPAEADRAHFAVDWEGA